MSAVMTVLEAVDQHGEVTRVALEAQIALEAGDTPRASTLYQQAAEMIESAISDLKKPSERDLARFLAATHYYHGGHYEKAAKVCEKIREDRLPSGVRHLYPSFLKLVRERSAPDYAARYRESVKESYRRATEQDDGSAARKVIEILMDHSYLFPPQVMAHLRAKCCEILGERRAASLFYRDAWRFDPDNPNSLPLYLDSLCKEGRHAEAWGIVEDELVNHPGARSSVYAILVRGRQFGTVADQQQRQLLLTDLLKHFESALGAYRSLSVAERAKFLLWMDWVFALIWDVYRILGDTTKQWETLADWIELRPDSPYPHILRGMMRYPEEASNQDFRQAIRLKSAQPWPYYFLAQEALRSRDFRECDRLCTLALQRNPQPDIRATLLTWMAISRWNLGFPRSDIRKLFDEARRLKPDDPLIANYAQAFDRNQTTSIDPSAPSFEGERYWRERAEQYVNELSRRGIAEMSPALDASLV
jgi:tetratricopeptide (TPR) repeat protein